MDRFFLGNNVSVRTRLNVACDHIVKPLDVH